MGAKSKIQWTDSTWNPVSGCYHDCKYCYARDIAQRFEPNDAIYWSGQSEIILEEPIKVKAKNGKEITASYPYGFAPTFHRYMLDRPQGWKKPRKIFMCSMADLFGEWVPDEWIKDVFDACEKAMRHTYLFLTKNPKRYIELEKKGLFPHQENMWFGTSITTNHDLYAWINNENISSHSFLSIEPILEPLGELSEKNEPKPEWVIVGAETGHRKGRIIPERRWIEDLVNECRKHGIPIFMKESPGLKEAWKEPLIQEYPESLKRLV